MKPILEVTFGHLTWSFREKSAECTPVNVNECLDLIPSIGGSRTLRARHHNDVAAVVPKTASMRKPPIHPSRENYLANHSCDSRVGKLQACHLLSWTSLPALADSTQR